MAIHRIVPRATAGPAADETRLDADVAAVMAAAERAAPHASPSPDPARLLDEIVRPLSPTDAMVAAIGDQLCAIVKDNYDFTITVDTDTDNIHIQKLTLLLNSLLESARRNIRSLSELANDLEEKVRERTQRLNLVVQGANDGVWIWDPRNGTAEFSARWRQLLGLENATPGRIEDWLDRVHPDDIERLRAALRAHLQGTTQFLHEDYRIRHSDGTYRWMWCRGKCSRDATGRATMMAGTQTDVHALRSVDGPTGLPNESTALTQIDDMLKADIPFRAMVIGVPRVVSMKEDLGTAEIEVLRAAIARRLSAALPFDADLARLSGDFYVALLPCTASTLCEVPAVAEALARAFARPFEAGGRAIWLDAWAGATMLIRGRALSASDVMRDAWTSYRCARTEGRQVNLLSAAQQAAARERALMAQEVRAGLDNGWFVPFLQPIVDLHTGLTRGFETLVRLDHPKMGLLPPGRFIPVAEEIGLMGDISLLMLRRAVALLAQMGRPDSQARGLFLSVNLDAARILEPTFVTELGDLLATHGVAAANLKIEIVESSVIGNFVVAARQIARLRDLGVRIALDDFGTGYSSLEYLNQLDFDLIKIDKTFMDDIQHDSRKQSMVRMMSVLADLLGADVCVEGVEDEAQAAIARALNIQLAQGYLYARPLPAAEALARFSRGPG
jgi:PAS domain S-box-containing protein